MQLAVRVLATVALRLPPSPRSSHQPHCNCCHPSRKPHSSPLAAPPPAPTQCQIMPQPKAEHPSALKPPCVINLAPSLHLLCHPDGAEGDHPGDGCLQVCRRQTFARVQTSQKMLLWCLSMSSEHELQMPWKAVRPGCLCQLGRDGQRDAGGFSGSQHCPQSAGLSWIFPLAAHQIGQGGAGIARHA